MLNLLKRSTWILILLLNFACDGYNKILKSTDAELQLVKANEYYDAEKYSKALPLYESVYSLARGSNKAEDILYKMAYCNYHMGLVVLASGQFDTFTKTFPYSDKSEECAYMKAYCHYLLSPAVDLEQSETQMAIDQFQIFADQYPSSSLMDSVNHMMDRLNGKLDEKAFQQADLFYNQEKYKAAIVAFKNVLKDFPSTAHREEIYYKITKASFELAKNSIESKKEERFVATKEAYINFIDLFTESKYRNELERVYKQTLLELDKMNKS